MECHGHAEEHGSSTGQLVLVGNSNVGKSALFSALTGRYVTISNYPGTTVELAHGTADAAGRLRAIIDTPGVGSLLPTSEDERVTRDVVLREDDAVLVQVADAKNLRRALLLTFELAETGRPMVLALNMSDEASAHGIWIDAERLSAELGVPVVPTVAPRREGVDELIEAVGSARPPRVHVDLGEDLERAERSVESLLPPSTHPRADALALLAGDDDLAERLELNGAQARLDPIRAAARERIGAPIGYELNRRRLMEADRLIAEVVRTTAPTAGASDRLGRLAIHPLWGWPIVLAILAAMYVVVGWLGATVLVGFLEDTVFGEWINPAVADVVSGLPPMLERFLVGEYGLVTMALTYGLAIILPIVTTFFLMFGLLEDSGYLPRLGVVLDRSFRRMGLNGKAVLPMMLGLGCVTMATMTTRVLETRKERLQVTLLLALAIPCSAQLGVILGMIGATGALGIAIWSSIVVGTLLTVGWLSARVLPGSSSDFILELPPMRTPSLRNIGRKTAARLEWYLREVIPVFVVATAVLFVLDETGGLEVLERALAPIVQGWLGLPAAATAILLVGFFRRDYGAAGLFALAAAGAMTGAQVLVSLVVITLFVPCIASVLMIVREQGVRTAAAIVAFTFVLAIGLGGLVRLVLEGFGVAIG